MLRVRLGRWLLGLSAVPLVAARGAVRWRLWECLEQVAWASLEEGERLEQVGGGLMEAVIVSFASDLI